MSDKDRSLIEELDAEYDRSVGFLGKLRFGVFDHEGASRLLGLLERIELDDGPVDRRLVQLLWFMPTFIQWQKERFSREGQDIVPIDDLLIRTVEILEEKLGVP